MLSNPRYHVLGGIGGIFCYPDLYPRISDLHRFLWDPRVSFAFGIHPKNANEATTEVMKDLKWYLKTERVVALGEIGLDYSSKYCPPKEKQKEVLRDLILWLTGCGCHYLYIIGTLLKTRLGSSNNTHCHTFLYCFTGTLDEFKLLTTSFPCAYSGLTAKIITTDLSRIQAEPPKNNAKPIPVTR